MNNITAGDTIDFEVGVPGYPRSDGWTLAYRLIPRVGSTVISITAGASAYNGADYRVQAAASTTALYATGFYAWSALVSRGSERHQVLSGSLQVFADPGVVTTHDNRTHARKTLDAIEAVIEGRASKDQMAYTIGTRSLERTPLEDLLMLRDRYRAEVAGEEALESMTIGGPRLLARL